jgi:putative SOS response-associated peptidase YedK
MFLTQSLASIATQFGEPAGDVPDLGLRRNISPGEDVLALGPSGFRNHRWGLVPVGRTNARGRPVMETIVNARSETVFDKSAFVGVKRAIVPASGWYEWTGEKPKKTAWEITAKGKGLLLFAAITDVWVAPGGLEVHQVATVTCPPNADLEPIHHRMGVLLKQSDIELWIHGDTESAAALMTPWPNGLLHITKADPAHFD